VSIVFLAADEESTDAMAAPTLRSMPRFFPRIRGGSHDSAAVLDDLLDYHRDNPGVTEQTLGALRTAEGKTGYQLLAERVPPNATTVVDLGCGNGPLLRELRAPTIIGVDLCKEDLALCPANAKLLNVSGQTFGAHIEPGTVDAVLSHHAFYLMDPIEPVIASIARVLRPGGVFAFVTSCPRANEYEPFASMQRAFSANTKREHPTFRGWGDRRVWSEAGLHELLDRDFNPFTVDDFVLVADEPHEASADRLLRFYYSAELQSAAARDETRSAWLELMKPFGAISLPWAIVTTTRR
jgi:SAM-dependent methyltransferase